MAGTGRVRTRDDRMTHTGSFVRPNVSPNITYKQVSVGIHRHCTDVVGNPKGVNPLTLKINSYGVQYLDGERTSANGLVLQRYVAWPVPESITTILPSPNVTFGAMGFTRLQQYAWSLIAKTNPSAPHVSVPQNLGEMKDWKNLPIRLRDAGRNLLRQYKNGRVPNILGSNPTSRGKAAIGTARAAASGNLAWRFAIRPLLSDLNKLLDTTDSVAKRKKMLDDLAERKYLRRTAVLSRDSVTGTPATYFSSTTSGVSYQSQRQDVSTSKVWGSVCYRSISTTSIPESDIDRLYLARRLTHGITGWSTFETAWELIPWSWLADWFSSFGDSIKALNNTIPLAWTRICIMRDSTCSRGERIVTAIPQGVTVSGDFLRSEEWKERFLTFPVWPFAMSIPAIKPGQWSILGSLAILRS